MIHQRACRACGKSLADRHPVAKLCGNPDCLRADERARYKQKYKPTGGFASALDLTDADQSLRDRFWSKVDRRGPDECWPWTAPAQKNNGYGSFTVVKYYPLTASRVAYALEIGPLAAGQVVRHSCDNPPCCNPAHLLSGSMVDNANDCIQRGRGNRAQGERNGHARLTEAAVLDIRSTPMAYGVKARLARKYGVDHSTIRRVLTGEQWGATR